MTATAHALVGGAIAASVQNPAIGLPLAAISHPLLDIIPHWDLGIGWRGKNKFTLFFESVLDLSLGVIFAYLLFGSNINLFYFFSCILASEIWDIMMMPYLLWKWKGPFFYFYKIQSKIQGETKTMMTGILTQVGTVTVISLVLHIVRF